MSYTSDISDDIKEARKKPRDAHGRYVKKDTNPKDTVFTDVKSSSPMDAIKDKPDKLIEKPLVSFKINNPFKKLLYWLKDIRKKQTTTFDFKIKVPLIALPIFLIVLGAAFNYIFNLGKQDTEQSLVLVTPTPTIATTTTLIEKIVSKYGVIKATYQVTYLLNETVQEDDTDIYVSSDAASTPTPTPIPPSRYVLLDKNDKIVFLITPSEITLSKYINSKAIITGKYNEKESTLSISKEEDIEIIQ